MKKIIAMLMMLLISNIVVKAKEIEVTDSIIIGRAQAIVAYEMNCVSLKDNDTTLYVSFKSNFKDEKNFTIEDIRNFLKTKDKNLNIKLLNEIETLKPDPDSVQSLNLISFYSHSIFEKLNVGSEIGKFLKKRNESVIDDMKVRIENRLKEELNLYNKDECILSAASDGNKENNTKEIEEKSSGSIGAVLIPYFLLLGTVAVIVLLFKRNKELEKKVAGLIKEYNDELSNKENELQQLKKEVRNLKHQCEELIKSRDEVEEFYQGQLNSRTRKEPVKETQKEQENVQEDNQPKAYFVTSPKNDVFDEGTNTYRPGKAIYKIVSWDDISGEFEFINSKEAVDYARQSKSQYVEPACNILNDGDMAIEGIATERKGKVKRVDNGWSIIEKANVRLM